jgi:uncharacterized RDD family membrane protein YckC
MHEEPVTQMTPMPPPPAEELNAGRGGAAGFWRRFGSSLIDGILLGIVSGILQYVLGRGLGWLVGLVVALAYFMYFHGRTGQSPGNAALGIKVLDIDTQQPIGYGRAAGRWVVSYISGIVILVGYLWMLWDPQKQTWHDKAARSLPLYTGSNV